MNQIHGIRVLVVVLLLGVGAFLPPATRAAEVLSLEQQVVQLETAKPASPHQPWRQRLDVGQRGNGVDDERAGGDPFLRRAGARQKRPCAMMHTLVLMAVVSTLWLVFGYSIAFGGFNAGSAVNVGELASSAFAATHFSAVAAALSWAGLEWLLKGKPSVFGIALGMVAGLATITPASGFVTVPAAFAIGLCGGDTCYLAVTKLKAWLGYDDSLDVFGVHGVGSTVGLLLLGLFANPAVNGAIATTFKSGGQVISLAGGLAQFKNQLVGVLFAAALAAGATFMILKLVGLIIDLRISAEDEHSGLDLTRHGESAYND